MPLAGVHLIPLLCPCRNVYIKLGIEQCIERLHDRSRMLLQLAGVS